MHDENINTLFQIEIPLHPGKNQEEKSINCEVSLFLSFMSLRWQKNGNDFGNVNIHLRILLLVSKIFRRIVSLFVCLLFCLFLRFVFFFCLWCTVSASICIISGLIFHNHEKRERFGAKLPPRIFFCIIKAKKKIKNFFSTFSFSFQTPQNTIILDWKNAFRWKQRLT